MFVSAIMGMTATFTDWLSTWTIRVKEARSPSSA